MCVSFSNYIKCKNKNKLKEKKYIPQGKTLYRRKFLLDIVKTRNK